MCAAVKWHKDPLRARPHQLTYLSQRGHDLGMPPDAIRTSLDVPRELHRRIHEAAARRGCSARTLMLEGIERAVEETQTSRPRRRLKLDPPLIRPAGRHLGIASEVIYDLIELP